LGYVANGFFVDKEGDQVPAAQGVYLIQLAAATATSFTVQAVPQNAQAGDTLCGTLSLTDTGIRTANSVTCW
jgi:type IV pilus assembly protein PilE